MGQLEPVVSDRRVLLDQIEEYRDFLAGTPRGERDEFLPFFQARPQLAVFLGNLHSHIGAADHVAYEFPLWGDFVCDLVAGSRAHGAFVFAEFEDAGEKSLFNRVRRRRVSRWGNRVESGISQVTDWLFRLDSARNSAEMERDLGTRAPRPVGLVVVGRSAEIDAYDASRLQWRSRNTIIGGSQIIIWTYDDLLAWLDSRAMILRTEEQEG